MSFYSELSKYYDDIFPASDEQVNFIKSVVGNPEKKLADIACGTGGYSLKLAEIGYDVTAMDIDSEMIKKLKSKCANKYWKLDFVEGNMLNLREKITKRDFDLVFCLGNSVVHLNDLNEIQIFFQESKLVLTNKGSLIMQIINFDRILNKNIKELPTIFNKEKDLEFQRKYRHIDNKIGFKSKLKIGAFEFENEVMLVPLKFKNTLELLSGAGFSNIKAYGDFNKSPFMPDDSFMLVVCAQ